MLYLCILLIFVFFAGVAMTINEGLWSNLVNLISVLFAGTTALFLGIPAGAMALEKSGKDATFTWYFLFAGVWLVFFATSIIIRTLFDRTSRVRVRFIPQIDKALGIVLGLGVAWLFTSLLALTLLKFPIEAGAWDFKSAASWQQTWMVRASTPFNSVAKRIQSSESLDVGL